MEAEEIEVIWGSRGNRAGRGHRAGSGVLHRPVDVSHRQQTASLIAALMMCQEATWPDQTRSQSRVEAVTEVGRGLSSWLWSAASAHPLLSSSAQLAQHSVMMAIIARFSNNLYEILQCWPRLPLRTRHFLFAPNGNAPLLLPLCSGPGKCDRVSMRWAPPSWKWAAAAAETEAELSRAGRAQVSESARAKAAREGVGERASEWQRERTLVSEVDEVWRVRIEQLSSYFTLHWKKQTRGWSECGREIEENRDLT